MHLHGVEQRVELVVDRRRVYLDVQGGSICFLVGNLKIDFNLGEICVQVVGFEGEFKGGGSVCQRVVRRLGDLLTPPSHSYETK